VASKWRARRIIKASQVELACARVKSLPGCSHPQLRDKNRGDIGKSQSKWTACKMETPGSRLPPLEVRRLALVLLLPPPRCRRGWKRR
jgi:hypothetical protein